MALYSYQAFSKDGKKITGVLDATSESTVKEMLIKQGVFPIKILPVREQEKIGFLRRLFQRRVSVKDKILFTRQLSTLLKSGVPILQSLELLVDHFEARFRGIVIQLKDDIKEGKSLAESLKQFSGIFSNLYIQLVRAGEASGKLEIILDRLIEYMERREKIKKRVRSALAYPTIQLVLAVVVVVFLMQYVVPSMVENFQQSGQRLPFITEIIVEISSFFTNYLYFLLVGFITIIILFYYWRSTKSGARALDKIKLRLPLIKYFSKTGAVVQFSSTLGMLVESGVNLSESLDIVCSIIDNRILADTLHEARDKIIKQGKIAQYLKQTDVFPPIAIYLIKTGEESGQLGQMLLTVSKNYEEELGDLADSLSAKLGPVMLLVMAFVVLVIALALILPMLEMADMSDLERVERS